MTAHCLWFCADYVISLASRYVDQGRLRFGDALEDMHADSLVSFPDELGEYPVSSAVLMAMQKKGGFASPGPNAAADAKKPRTEANRVDGRAEYLTGDAQEMSDVQVAFLCRKFAIKTLIDPATEDRLIEATNKLEGPTITKQQIRQWWTNHRRAKISQAAKMSDAQRKALVELFKQNRKLKRHRRDDILKTLNDLEGSEVTYAMVQKWWHNEHAKRTHEKQSKKRKAAGQAESTRKRQRTSQ